ncbi:hypothetical protein ACYU03_04425 [Pseudomonas sp. X10]
MAKVNKRIYYFRVLDGSGSALDFSEALAEISDRITIGDSEITMIDEVVRIQRFEDTADGRLYHITKYSPGSQNTTLTPRAAVKEDEEVGVDPPKGKEFKSGECYIFVSGFHILFCGHGLTHAKAAQYFFRLLKDNAREVDNFRFMPISNVDKLQLLNEQGVKSIRLNIAAYKLSLPKVRRNWISQSFTSVTDELAALIKKDATRSEEKALEDLMVSIEVGLEGNSRAAEDSKATVVDLAKEIIEDDELFDLDSFTILTRENTPITGGDVRLHTTVRPEKEGSSLSRAIIWDGMKVYFGQLKKQKLLEQ